MTCSFQLRVVAAFLKNRETSLPHFTQAFILLLKTASGPSRYVPLCLSPAPPLLEPLPPHTHPAPPPSPCLACHERDAEAALLLSTSSIFICQTAVSTAVLAGLQCFVCSVEFVGVHVVCACARAQFHDSCGLVCILVLCVKGGKKKKDNQLFFCITGRSWEQSTAEVHHVSHERAWSGHAFMSQRLCGNYGKQVRYSVPHIDVQNNTKLILIPFCFCLFLIVPRPQRNIIRMWKLKCGINRFTFGVYPINLWHHDAPIA